MANVTVNGTDYTNITKVLFPVTGSDTYAEFSEGSGSGDADTLGALISGTLESYTNDQVTTGSGYIFAYTKGVKHVSLPNLTSSISFQGCTTLETVHIPKVQNIGSNCFNGCTALKYFKTSCVNFHTDANAFNGCTNMTVFDSQYSETVTGNYWYYISGGTFGNCANLETVILRVKGMPYKLNGAAFDGTPIASGSGYIYVPADLVDTYKAADNWSSLANQIRAIEDYPDITAL